jgi:hypothetical protein
MALVEGVEARPQRCTAVEGLGPEPVLHRRVGLLPVGLEREQVGAATRRDLLGDRGPAGERIQADQATA